MSKAKSDWYPYVKKRLYHYPKSLGDTLQGGIEDVAIKRAIRETLQRKDGQIRYRVLDLVFFQDKFNIDGAALQVHVSPRTAQRYCIDFVYLCAKHMGYR